MGKILDYLSSDAVDNEIMMKNALITFLSIVIVYLLIRVIGYLSNKFIKSEKRTTKLIRASRVFIILAWFYYVLNLWFENSRMLGVVITLILAFIALASKDIILDIVAYIYISTRKPFSINQVVEINGICGELIDIDFLQFNLAEMGSLMDNKAHTGRYVSIPNRFIFKHPVINYNHTNPFIMVETSVLIDFSADRKKALRIAGEVAYEKHLLFLEKFEIEKLEEFKKKMRGLNEEVKPKIRAELDNNGFRIYIQFIASYDKIGMSKSLVQNALYDEYVKEGIKMPTPQYIRLVSN